MIIPDKKKAVGIIVSRFKDGKETQSVQQDEFQMDDKRQSLHAIASELLSAVQNGSAGDVATALEAFNHSLGVTED